MFLRRSYTVNLDFKHGHNHVCTYCAFKLKKGNIERCFCLSRGPEKKSLRKRALVFFKLLSFCATQLPGLGRLLSLRMTRTPAGLPQKRQFSNMINHYCLLLHWCKDPSRKDTLDVVRIPPPSLLGLGVVYLLFMISFLLFFFFTRFLSVSVLLQCL